MRAMPEVSQFRRMLPGFGNKTGIEGQHPRSMGWNGGLDQRPIQADKVEGLIKLTGKGRGGPTAIATEIAKIDLAPQD